MGDVSVGPNHPHSQLLADFESAAGPAASSLPNGGARSSGPYPKRSVKACVECRSKKQRCTGPSSIPCERCAAAKRGCSFENDYVATDSGHRPVAFNVQTLLDMQAELSRQRARIENLESLLGTKPPASEASSDEESTMQDGATEPGRDSGTLDGHMFNGENFSDQSPNQTSTSQEWQAGSKARAKRNQGLISLRGIEMDVPVAVLHTMDTRVRSGTGLRAGANGALTSEDYASSMSERDPVKLGFMDMVEAQDLFDLFWTHCAPICSVLCKEGQRHAFHVSAASPLLFTVVLSIAARFWNVTDPRKSILHPAYWQIVELVDKQLSEMLLRPKASNIDLDTIQALLLYCQYSPLQPLQGAVEARTRFSDSKAWLVISLALRLAKVLHLGRKAANFPGQPSAVTQGDMKQMRVWINLLSVDHLLSLSANLAPSLDPSPAARGVRDFASHALRQDADVRGAGMYEVILIVHRLAIQGDQPLVTQIGTGSLRRANEELDEWERRWHLSVNPARNNDLDPQFTFPLTSLRWYRIALNSASTGAYASARQINDEFVRLQGVSLTIAVESAAQMLWLFSLESTQDHTSRGWQAFRPAALTVNVARVKALAYSVDSYWMTHSFAAALLAIAFDRGAIDSSLNLQSPPQSSFSTPTSPLTRLLTLAVDLVDQVVAIALHHPAAAYRPYFQAALQTCAPMAAGDVAAAGEDNSLEDFLQFLASKDNINLGAFQDTLFTSNWDGTTWS